MASKLLAAILTAFIPGLGQFYAGRLLRALAVFFGFVVVSGLLAATGIGAILIPVVWVLVIYDAFKIA